MLLVILRIIYHFYHGDYKFLKRISQELKVLVWRQNFGKVWVPSVGEWSAIITPGYYKFCIDFKFNKKGFM